MNIRGRLEKLEAAEQAVGRSAVIVCKKETETGEQAEARWRAQHPDSDALDRPGVTVIFWGDPR
jgi:hypothetical protein